jgi:DNA-binding XRE family transcriptional regulator
MSPSEFMAARKTLGLTHEEMADELGLTPHVIAGIENRNARVPKGIESKVNWLVAVAQRDAVLAASGLPECPVALKLELELERAFDQRNLDDAEKADEALTTHSADCRACNALEEYANKHAPPIPDFPESVWLRPITYLLGLLERLPPPLFPSKGDQGDGRRMGVVMAAGFSAIAISVAVLTAIVRLAAWGLASAWWRESLAIIATVPLAYLVGFFLAGATYDLTRPIAHRFAGYVLRGALTLPAIYGAVGVAAPLVSNRAEWSYLPATMLGVTIVGALAGSMLWVIDLAKGKLPPAGA